MAYTNSSLVNATYLSPNCYSGRLKILGVIPHCYVGYASMASCGSWFGNRNSNASCNYYIDAMGNVALIVPESKGAWTTSNYTVDMTHVTIECASDSKAPYSMTDATYKKLIQLTADIYKRNGIKECKWTESKANDQKAGYIPMHRNYKNKACPGDWLVARYKSGDFCKRVNAILNGSSSTSTVSESVNITYAVQVEGGKYYPAVKNLEDYAGVEKKKIIGFTAKVSRGSIKYRSHRIGGSWGGWVTGSDFSFKDITKYSGDGKRPIDLIEAIYYTPKGETAKYLYYRVSPINASYYYPYQKDDISGGGYDGYAGSSNTAIDKLQMYID